MARIQKDQDTRAVMELAALQAHSETEHKLNTRKIHKKLTEGSRTILFLSYKPSAKRY